MYLFLSRPPGTGKTSTILGLVGTFLSKRPAPATKIHADRQSTAEDKEPPKKILICAPSNAAIDEVAFRLKQGIKTAKGTLLYPKIVRVGNEDKMSPLVKDLSLDELVSSLLTDAPKSTDVNAIRDRLKIMKPVIDSLYERLNNATGGTDISEIEKELREKKAERSKFIKILDAAKEENQKNQRSRDTNLRKFEAQILYEADVICCTLSGSGHHSLTPFTFETVIIDEAAQSVELSSLIPLKYGTTQVILVGGELMFISSSTGLLAYFVTDPQQLAPTVLSKTATRFDYNQSLFVRLHKKQEAYLLRCVSVLVWIQTQLTTILLFSIQYRMHPSISLLPSRVFYNSRLQDGDNMAKLRTMPWHKDTLFKPYHFIDVADGLEERAYKGFSLLNKMEAKIAVLLYERLRERFSTQYDFDNRVGIIAMYDAQKSELLRAFTAKFGQTVTNRIAFGTVDGFQGQEKDIIIVSVVRGGPGITRIGHVSDARRMNVAITRARASLFILGHAATLSRDDSKEGYWKHIIEDARDRKLLTTVSSYRSLHVNLLMSFTLFRLNSPRLAEGFQFLGLLLIQNRLSSNESRALLLPLCRMTRLIHQSTSHRAAKLSL